MPSYSSGDVVLVRYPFTDLTSSKVRPAVAVGAPHASQDIFVVPLTSKTGNLQQGEFILKDWAGAGLRLPTAAKRGIFSVHETLVIQAVGQLSLLDSQQLERSLRAWLGL